MRYYPTPIKALIHCNEIRSGRAGINFVRQAANVSNALAKVKTVGERMPQDVPLGLTNHKEIRQKTREFESKRIRPENIDW